MAENFVNQVSIYKIRKQVVPSTSSTSSSSTSSSSSSSTSSSSSSSTSSSSSSAAVLWKFDKTQSLKCTGAAAVAVYPRIDPPIDATPTPIDATPTVVRESSSTHNTEATPLENGGVILVCASYHDPRGAQVMHPHAPL